MTKSELNNKVDNAKTKIQSSLQLVIDELNQGQRKKLVKNEEVKELFDFYKVNYQ